MIDFCSFHLFRRDCSLCTKKMVPKEINKTFRPFMGGFSDYKEQDAVTQFLRITHRELYIDWSRCFIPAQEGVNF